MSALPQLLPHTLLLPLILFLLHMLYLTYNPTASQVVTISLTGSWPSFFPRLIAPAPLASSRVADRGQQLRIANLTAALVALRRCYSRLKYEAPLAVAVAAWHCLGLPQCKHRSPIGPAPGCQLNNVGVGGP